jgi:hypothetical protein
MTKTDAKKLTYKINTEITENNITTETKQVRSPYLPMTENISDVEENTTTAEIFANAMKVINTNEDMDFNNNEIFYARKISAEELELDIQEKYHYDDCDYTFHSYKVKDTMNILDTDKVQPDNSISLDKVSRFQLVPSGLQDYFNIATDSHSDDEVTIVLYET